MECREVREYLPAYVEGERYHAVNEHLQGCADCRRVLEGYRELGMAMAGLVEHTLDPPPWLLETLRVSVAHRARVAAARAARLRQLADPRVAGGAVVAAAAVAGALVLRGRRRRRSGLRRLRSVLAQA
jgi:predicted anti-sigma-YlaC factor YlaD